ncbi:MAG: hypothetical protein N4A49_04340 [Marinifilaceae bacterium]|jgi:hypothetical protein|nr:hypothetical protein [Marinifilaceae bacterium]
MRNLFSVICLVFLFSCQKEITYPNFQNGEAPNSAEAILAKDFDIKSIPEELSEKYDIDLSYYTKYTSVWGIPIVSSSEVDDIYLQNTAELVGIMLSDKSLNKSKSKQIRDLLFQNMLRIAIFPENDKGTIQLPEFRSFSDADAYGATKEIPVIGFCCYNVAEVAEGIFQNDKGRIKQGNSLVHEIMHSIHNFAALKLFPDFNKDLKYAFSEAQVLQIWPKEFYINENYKEYLAESAEIWFNWRPYSLVLENKEFFFPEQHDLRKIDFNMYRILSSMFNQNELIMDRLSFASPKIVFNINLHAIFGYEYDKLSLSLYGDGEKFRSEEFDSSAYSSIMIIPNPVVSFYSYDNYMFKAILQKEGEVINKQFVFSQNELLNYSGFPSDIDLSKVWK